VLQHRFALNELSAFAHEHLQPEDHVALEATTNTWAIVAKLKPLVKEVVVSNPLQTKAIAQAKVKTDKVDALVLAQLLRCEYLPRVWQPDDATAELRRLTGRRAGLVGDRTRLKNRLHSVLAQRLLAPPVEKLFSQTGLTWLRQLDIDAEGRLMIDSDLRLLDAVEREIEVLDQLLAQKGYGDAQVKLLMTLPGVDRGVAQAVLAALGDVGRFADADRAASYLGLVPSTHQSADRCFHGPITKAGRGHARWMLVQAAQHVAKHPGPLGVFFRRLKKKKNHNVAVVATARKLVVIAWHMLKNNQPYRYAQPKNTATKLARLRVQATGKRRGSGQTKGRSRPASYGSGQWTRRTKALPAVYAEEGLPSLAAPPPGEARVAGQSEVADFVQSLNADQVQHRPRGGGRPRKQPVAAAVGSQPAQEH